MHINVKICSEPISISPVHSYALICKKYAKICKICKHESHMQNMQKYALPTLLMLQCARPGPRRGGARQEKTVSRLELARHVFVEFLVGNII